MQRINPVDSDRSNGKVKELLDVVQSKFGMTPRMTTTMAQSSAVLEGYLNFSDALGKGELKAELREQIALLSAEINRCGYCASAHTAIGKLIGLTDGAILNARRGRSNDEQTSIALNFVRNVIVNRGQVSDSDVEALHEAGFSDGEIGEIVANVAVNIFTNYFNIIADTEIDFPAVEIGAAA